jgi:hypothetical protein
LIHSRTDTNSWRICYEPWLWRENCIKNLAHYMLRKNICKNILWMIPFKTRVVASYDSVAIFLRSKMWEALPRFLIILIQNIIWLQCILLISPQTNRCVWLTIYNMYKLVWKNPNKFSFDSFKCIVCTPLNHNCISFR